MRRIIAFVFALIACPALASERITPQAVQEAQLRNEPRAGNQADPLIVKAQILLDRAGFSPGEIDGRRGENFRKSVKAFAQSKGLLFGEDLTPEIWAELAKLASEPVVTTYD